MRFPAKKNAGCPQAPRDFPPRKDGILHPRRVALGLPSPFPRVCMGACVLASQPNFLASIGYRNFLGNGAPLACYVHWLHYQSTRYQSTKLKTLDSLFILLSSCPHYTPVVCSRCSYFWKQNKNEEKTCSGNQKKVIGRGNFRFHDVTIL